MSSATLSSRLRRVQAVSRLSLLCLVSCVHQIHPCLRLFPFLVETLIWRTVQPFLGKEESSMSANTQGLLLAPSATASGCEASETLELWVCTAVLLLSAVVLCLLLTQSMRLAPVQGLGCLHGAEPNHGSIHNAFRYNGSSETAFSPDLSACTSDSTSHFRRQSETPDDHVIWIKWDLAKESVNSHSQGPK